MSSSIARASIEELHDFSRMAHGNAELNFSLGRGVSEKFAYGEFLEPPEIESLRSFVHSHAHDDPFVLGVLQYAGDSVIQLLWPEFIKHGVEWQESRSAFVQAAALRAPADTFQRLVECSHSTPEDIGIVVESWLRDDPISASHEVSRNARLAENPSLHDRAALKIVHYAVAHDERDTAESWADLITDPAEKEQAVRALQNRR